MVRSCTLLTVLLVTTSAAAVAGQDVEMLGRRYGTPVPEGYERTESGLIIPR